MVKGQENGWYVCVPTPVKVFLYLRSCFWTANSPVRLVTDLVSAFEPENWHRRGYLEARIPVFAAKEELWMLVFTRAQDLEGQTVIKTRRGPHKIPHVSTGELGLIMMAPQ